MYDLIIIGAGPAGLSAAIYAARGRVNTLVIGNLNQSRVAKAHIIDNYFGFPEGVSGAKLIELGATHVERFGGRIIPGEVVSVTLMEDFEVELANGSKYSAKAIILATGVAAKSSGIGREEELVGKGVSYCANCDGFFYRNRRVAVIGNGNYAAKEALDILPHTRDLTIFSHGKQFQISESLMEELTASQVTFREEKIAKFVGEEQLEALELASGDKWPVDGAFLALGTASSVDFARTMGLEIDRNYIVVDADCQTNFPGVFAAGDCTGSPLQVAKGVGQGCAAAIAAMSYLRRKR